MDAVLSWPPVELNTIDPKFKCPGCKQIYVNVYQVDDCGCRFCSRCLELLYKAKKRKCPKCSFKLASNVSELFNKFSAIWRKKIHYKISL